MLWCETKMNIHMGYLGLKGWKTKPYLVTSNTFLNTLHLDNLKWKWAPLRIPPRASRFGSNRLRGQHTSWNNSYDCSSEYASKWVRWRELESWRWPENLPGSWFLRDVSSNNNNSEEKESDCHFSVHREDLPELSVP